MAARGRRTPAPPLTGRFGRHPSLKVSWLIHASIQISFFFSNRNQPDFISSNEMPHQWLQGKVIPGQGCGKMRGSFSRINGGKRFKASFDDRNDTAPPHSVTAKNLHLFARHERHIDREDSKV